MCTSCNEWRDDDDFYRRSKEKTARSLRCKKCHIEYSREYYLKTRNAYCEARAMQCDIKRASASYVEKRVMRLQRSAVYYERQIYTIGCKDYPPQMHVTVDTVRKIFTDYLDHGEQSLLLYRPCALIRKDPEKPISRNNFQLVDYQKAREFIHNIKTKARLADSTTTSESEANATDPSSLPE